MDTSILFKDMIKREGEWSKTAAKLHDVRLQLKALALIEKELLSELVELSEGKNSYDKKGFVFKIFSRKGSVDYSKIPQLFNLDLEQFRKEDSEYWKLDKIR
jgi:hypothetical protein